MRENDKNGVNSPDSSTLYNRRTLLSLGSGIALTSLTGCMDNPSDDGTSTDSGSGGTPNNGQSTLREEDVTIKSIHNPANQNWQPFSPKFPNDTANLYLHWTSQNYLTGESELELLEDWNFDPESNTRTLKLKQGFKWWNGDPLTMEDLYVAEEINRLQTPESSTFTKNELVDDHTLKQTYRNAISPSLARTDISQRFQFYRGTWKPWLEKYRDASGQEARDKITTDLQHYEISTQEWIEKGLGNGPYKLTDASSTKYIGKKWDEHPWADKITVPILEQRVYNDSAVLEQLIKNDRLDSAPDPFPSQLRDVSPDHLKTLAEHGFPNNHQMIINWKGPGSASLKQRGVRRAILAAVDLEDIIQHNNDQGIKIPTQTGIDPAMAENWLGKEFIDNLIQYPVKGDTDKAKSFLQSTDHTYENGQVLDKDGNQATISMLSLNSAWPKAVADSISAQLDAFGFKIDTKIVNYTQLSGPLNDTLDFDIHVNSHFGGINFHPIDYFNPTYIYGVRLGPNGKLGTLQQWREEGKEYSPYNGKPLRPKIPREIGATELGSDPIEVDHVKLWKELQQSTSKERSTEIVKLFARAWNFHLQGIDCHQEVAGMWGDTANFQWPEQGNKEYKLIKAVHETVKNGNVGAMQS